MAGAVISPVMAGTVASTSTSVVDPTLFSVRTALFPAGSRMAPPPSERPSMLTPFASISPAWTV